MLTILELVELITTNNYFISLSNLQKRQLIGVAYIVFYELNVNYNSYLLSLIKKPNGISNLLKTIHANTAFSHFEKTRTNENFQQYLKSILPQYSENINTNILVFYSILREELIKLTLDKQP